MSFAEWFGFNRASTATDELPQIFPVPISQADFVRTDIIAIYTKILTDVLERTHGISEDQVAMLWDNCVKTNMTEGLITRLAKAMAEKSDLFVVYEKALGVVRPATGQEQIQIRAEYDKQGESSVGIFISFQNFHRSDMIKFYIGMEYCTVGSLHKSMNLSKAIQLKMNDLRASVSLADAADAKTQALAIAVGLGKGNDVLLDAKDSIETSTPDLTAVKASVEFLIQKLSFYLGLPDSYIIGEQTSGMGTTGENDMRAVERGLKSYFFSIMKPTLETLFGIKVTYKSQDFRQIAGSMDVLKIFSLVDESLVSQENKTMIINKLLDLPEDAKGDPAPKQVALPAPPAAAVPVPPVPPTVKANA